MAFSKELNKVRPAQLGMAGLQLHTLAITSYITFFNLPRPATATATTTTTATA